MHDQSSEIIHYILNRLSKHPADIVAVTAKQFKVTRTTVHRHLAKLITENKIMKTGTTRAVQYYLSSELNRSHTYKINSKLSEYEVYRDDFDPILKNMARNISDICNYVFTEIFNNAIDHSRGTKIRASIEFTKNDIVIAIQDDGIGIFNSIFNYFSLDDLRESALQLNKGKMTTDPANHTGEGIFFSSRAMDVFEIYANNLHYIRNNREDDWGLQSIAGKMSGSKVVMCISKHSGKNLTPIFESYQDEESLAFTKTDILVEMSKWGDETLISRSQAKRILRNLDKFNHVTLDFKNIRLIGQGFVDEIFRVYANKHPSMTISYINANSDVEFMIKRSSLS